MAKLPVDISDFLTDESREFYRKALKSLEFEYGIGALAYFKRMIKNEIGRIIEALSNPYSADGNKITEVIASYEQGWQKTRFIEEVTPHLPNSLKEHGANILLVLHDTISISIHELTEKECIKKSKDIDSLFRYMIRRINGEMKQGPEEKDPGKYFLRYS
jgi:phosphate uptake regulator